MDCGDFGDEDMEGEQHNEPSATGNKRAETQRSSAKPKPPKPRKKMATRSVVWSHFTRKADDYDIGVCHYCSTEIGCDSASTGTTPMKNHLARCKLYQDFQASGEQQILSPDSNGNLRAVKYEPAVFRRSVNEMVVLNELPFSFVESEGWRRFCLNVVPYYDTISRRTATRDIVAMYQNEKILLQKLFSVEKKRVSLTTDIWVAPTTSCSYMVITAHWIDGNWQLQKRVISFKPVTDHKGETIARLLIECLEEWGIEKVFTVTVDNARGNDKALRLFRNELRLSGNDALVLDGDHMHMRCCAHILNLIVGDGLAHINSSVHAIRNAVKYVRSSSTRLKSFELRCETGKVTRGSLTLDCVTRWNSTYLMLSSAIKLRVAFEKMLVEDKLYCDYFLEPDEEKKVKRIGPPTNVDWDEVERLVRFLKIFFNCTLAFSASKTVTSSLCYSEIVIIQRNLLRLSTKSDEELRKQALSMMQKFDKYWDGLMNMNQLVIVASVFDPRNKLQFAALCFDKLYGKHSLESSQLRDMVKGLMKKLFDEYSIRLKKPDQNDTAASKSGQGDSEQQEDMHHFSDDDDDDDDYERMDSLYSELSSDRLTDETSNEVDIYLLEETELRVKNSLGLEFDVLSWWKRNSVKFPILSEVARDVLAIQVSSVASESAFSTSGRILDPYRSCLTPFMVEVLICTQQWLRTSYQSQQDQIANLAQMLEEVTFYDKLDPQNSSDSTSSL